jgi:hypothetical protein
MAYQAVEEAFRLAREKNFLLREVLATRTKTPPLEAVKEAFRLAREKNSLLRVD